MKSGKKLLVTAGAFLAALVIMNAGIYFFLKSSQPKMGKRSGNKVAVHHVAGEADSARTVDSTTRTSTDSLFHTPAAGTGEIASSEQVSEPAETSHAKATKELTESDKSLKHDSTVLAPLQAADEPLSASSAGTEPEEAVKLSKLLQSMKPDEAASIITHLSTEQIVELLMRMKERNAAKIMAALPVEQAAKVATIMSNMANRDFGRR